MKDEIVQAKSFGVVTCLVECESNIRENLKEGRDHG
jgi:hypothetical protein